MSHDLLLTSIYESWPAAYIYIWVMTCFLHAWARRPADDCAAIFVFGVSLGLRWLVADAVLWLRARHFRWHVNVCMTWVYVYDMCVCIWVLQDCVPDVSGDMCVCIWHVCMYIGAAWLAICDSQCGGVLWNVVMCNVVMCVWICSLKHSMCGGIECLILYVYTALQ